MTYLYYMLGGAFLTSAFFSAYGLAYLVVAVSLSTNHIMSTKVLNNAGYWWYSYFAFVDFAVGVVLIGTDNHLLRWAGFISIAGGLATLACSRWPNWIHHHYEQIQAGLTCAFAFLLFAQLYGEAVKM